MAYKFQLGTAKLSGSIQLTDGSIDSTDVDDTTAANIVAQIDAGEIAIAKLAESTISGKALGDDLDALTAGNGISMSSYDGSAAVSDLAIQRSGSAHALKLDADGLAVLLSGSTGLAIDGGGLKLDAVPNSSLAQSAITLTQGAGMAALGSVSLGSSITVAVDGTLEDLDALGEVADDQFIVGTGAGTFAYESGATVRTSLGLGTGDNVQFTTGSFSGDLTVSGDLQVNGDLTYVNTVELKVKDALVTFASGTSAFGAGRGFEIGEGSDAEGSFKTALASGGTPNHFASSLALVAPHLISDGNIISPDWEISDTHLSGNLPVSASAFYGDGSNLSGVSADNASELDFNFAALSANGDVTARFTKVDSTSAAFTATMPEITADNDGAMFVIKDNVGQCASNSVTISANGTQKIENVDQDIILESGFAAVTMVASYNGGTNSGWMII